MSLWGRCRRRDVGALYHRRWGWIDWIWRNIPRALASSNEQKNLHSI
jgi:hypothetical protein